MNLHKLHGLSFYTYLVYHALEELFVHVCFRDVCIYLGKKTWSHMCYMYMYSVYTRCLLECFESAVPAIFLSYAPTFFIVYLNSKLKKKTVDRTI